MVDLFKKKPASGLLGTNTNALSKASRKGTTINRSLPAGPTGADRAKAAFDRHLQAVKSAQQNFADIKKRNRGY